MRNPIKSPDQFWMRVDRTSGDSSCWPWTGTRNYAGYGLVYYEMKQHRAHRLAARLSGSGIDGMVVCHKCDNPICCNPAHLFVGSHRDNNHDSIKKGRNAYGDRNGSRKHPDRLARGESSKRSKLKTEQVIDMRNRHANQGATYVELAIEYGVARQTARKIVIGELWAHVSNSAPRAEQ